jgi:hypothetical protein
MLIDLFGEIPIYKSQILNNSQYLISAFGHENVGDAAFVQPFQG